METRDPAPACSKLLCKGAITRAPQVLGPVAWYDATVWWCGETQKVVGPDDLPVGPEGCVRGRSCWRGRSPA